MNRSGQASMACNSPYALALVQSATRTVAEANARPTTVVLKSAMARLRAACFKRSFDWPKKVCQDSQHQNTASRITGATFLTKMARSSCMARSVFAKGMTHRSLRVLHQEG